MSDSGETKAMKNAKDPLPFGVFALFTPAEAMPRDRGLRAKRRIITLIACAVLLAICWGASQSPGFVEDVYANGWSQLVTRGIASITGIVPTSIGELLLILSLSWFVFPALYAIYNIARRRRRFLNALACGFLKLAVFLAVTVVLFQLFWGLNYSRAPLVDRLEWQSYTQSPKEADDQIDELEDLCKILVHKTNEAYAASMGSEESETKSYLYLDTGILNDEIDAGYRRIQEDFDMHESFGISRGPAKPFAASFVMDQLRISGVYLPWTAEANYNTNIPDVSKPHTMAHEKAHQRGVASENEANFFGYLACINSEHPYIQYSGYLFAQRQMLSALYRADAERARELIRQRYPGIQTDVNAINAYWAEFAGPVSDISHKVNDSYLKAKGVKAGVKSYGLSALLIISHYRRELAKQE
ncbi:DUF3810 domain-containing protein [Planctomycetota bacterium]|nr:DUF3810 domain-containing protein [Planctomycetota bacterium]